MLLGKSSFAELRTPQPAEPEPVESPVVANAPTETDIFDDSLATDTDSLDDPTDTGDVQPESITDFLTSITGSLELPVEGATGWAAVAMPLYNEADTESDTVADFDAGQVFVIITELDDWWYVRSSNGELGWVEHKGCLINLPDVIPSIVYNITNAYSARTRSSGYEIPGVTGHKLYDAFSYNPRLSRDEFITPSLYSSSKLLFTAQQLALESGDTIIMHEAYRAHASQMRSLALLEELIESNEEAKAAINDGPWNLGWFMSTRMSNHQRGAAFDVSLGKVLSHEIVQIGEMSFIKITEYEEYRMPTEIHELSPLAISLVRPVDSRDRNTWREVPLADTMTPGAIRLLDYFDRAGFTPLASEWWHFNDLDGAIAANELGIVGAFFISEILSFMP